MTTTKKRVLVFYGGECATAPRHELLAWLRGPHVDVDSRVVAEAVPHSGGAVDERVDEAILWADLAIALLTPDERGRAGAPNVLDEIGRWRGKKGGDTLCILRQQGVDEYSNLAGVVYVRFVSRVSERFEDIRRFLQLQASTSTDASQPEEADPSPMRPARAEKHDRVERWYRRGRTQLVGVLVAVCSLMLGLYRCSTDNVRRGQVPEQTMTKLSTPVDSKAAEAPAVEAHPIDGSSEAKTRMKHARREAAKDTVRQTMTNSPGGIQAGGNVTVNRPTQP